MGGMNEFMIRENERQREKLEYQILCDNIAELMSKIQKNESYPLRDFVIGVDHPEDSVHTLAYASEISLRNRCVIYKVMDNASIYHDREIYLITGEYKAQIIDREISGIEQLGLIRYILAKNKPFAKHDITHKFMGKTLEGVLLKSDTRIFISDI